MAVPPPRRSPGRAPRGNEPLARPARPAALERPTAALRVPTWLVVATILALGGADFALAIRTWVSLPLAVALSLLLVPWATIVVRETADVTADDAGHRRRTSTQLAFHLANIALVLVFAAAKWLTLIDALGDDLRESYVGPYRTYSAALMVLLVVGAVLRGGRVTRFVAASADYPARLMAVSFGVTSLIGTLLLSLPVAVHHETDVSLVDSLFIAVSSVCVTGLSPVNLAETYTFFGQAVICILVQVGGLGIMVITAAVTMLAGRRLGVKGAVALAEVVDSRSLYDVKRTVTMIVAYTLVFEAMGAGLLYLEFERIPEIARGIHEEGALAGAGSPEWAAVFHAVSAFCNAGISNFRGSVTPFVGSPFVPMTLGVLVVLGGLGFPVMHELIFRWRHLLKRHRPPRLTLNTRVTLATTGILLVGLALAYLVLESRASFRPFGFFESLNAALFQSISARSAGFNVVDVRDMRPASQLLTCFAMFIGGGSGSIAGGIKVTTFAVLFAAFRGELRGQRAQLFDRTIPEPVVRRAMSVGFLATLLVVAIVFLLLLVEEHDPISILVETVSAFSTTGLSSGITTHLSATTKFVLAVTMLVGRIGPLTAAVAISTRMRTSKYALPEERVMIG